MNVRKSYIRRGKGVDRGLAVFILCAAFFVIGSVLGIMLSSNAQFDAAVKEQLALSSESFGESVWRRLVYSLMCLLIVTVLGFSIFGVIGAPLMLCAKGLKIV